MRTEKDKAARRVVEAARKLVKSDSSFISPEREHAAVVKSAIEEYDQTQDAAFTEIKPARQPMKPLEKSEVQKIADTILFTFNTPEQSILLGALRDDIRELLRAVKES